MYVYIYMYMCASLQMGSSFNAFSCCILKRLNCAGCFDVLSGYRGASLLRNITLLGLYSRIKPTTCGGPRGGLVVNERGIPVDVLSG